MARFLNDNDYKKQIRQWVKSVITQGGDEDILTDAELAAQAEMSSYLFARYDITRVFDTSQLPAQRNGLVVMYLVDMALYHLHSSITPNNIPEVREKRYNHAIKFLEDVRDGDNSIPGLPDAPTETEDGEEISGRIALGCHEKYSERF